MKILVTGSSGMLGSSLVSELISHHDVSGLANRERKDFDIPFYRSDITNKSEVFEIILNTQPDLIIHAAAHVDADDCEHDPDHAFAVNTSGTRWIAEASMAAGAVLFFISSDYVFDGTKQTAYQEVDQPNPLNVYGKSKVLAEDFLRSKDFGAFIIRASWLFGKNGPNFFQAILKQIARKVDLKVVDDQIGAPTYTKDLAEALRTLAEKAAEAKERKGTHIYHIANSGQTTWFDAAKIIVQKVNLPVKVERIASFQLKRAAKRPHNSVLDMSKVNKDFGIEMRFWESALDEYWKDSLELEWKNLIKSR